MTRYIMQFSKTGTSCYISHLDLVRVFHRAFKRAGIKLEYSKGFNPHPKMGFAQPLSLGYTGMREYIEFETKEEHAPEDLGEMLKAQMPDGIDIHLCQFLEYPKKTLASVTEAAVYTVSIPLKKSVQMKADACKELYLGQDQIIVLKKQKKKKDLVEIDIKPKIREIEFLPLSKSLQIKMKIDAGSNSNLSPEQVIDSVLRCFAIDTDRSEISVTRHLIFFREAVSLPDAAGCAPELERWGMQEEDKAAWDQMDRIMEKSEILKNMQKERLSKVMILVIDGCAPAYISPEHAPRLHKLAKETGFAKKVQCAMPSVTNVNHACILSGKWPMDTGVIGNYYYDPETEEEGFIEERGYMKAETLLQYYKKLDKKTALLTVKGKVLGVYGDGADIGLSAQEPDPAVLERYDLSPAPAINSVEATEWIVRAAAECIRKDDPDLVYCTTNDYVFHHFEPGTPEACAQIKAINDIVSEIAELDPDRQIYITADHGMNQKHTIVNFPQIAKNAGFDVFCLPPLKDRYIENHIYQEGGMLYVFLKNPVQAMDFRRFAEEHPLVERVLDSKQAAVEYYLPPDKIGDFVLLAGEDIAFGEVEGESIHTEDSRTHGSLYEREIPLIGINTQPKGERFQYHKDVARYLMGMS